MGPGRMMGAVARALALALVGAATLLGLVACATNPVTGEPDFVLMSREREIELGKQYHQRILERRRVYDDRALQRYVERLGDAIAAKSHRPELDYTFTVLDDPSVNAFALPGGYIYINRGIMAYFNSEAELAGVLGHEIGHVTARHSVQQYSAATASSVLGSLLLAGAGAGDAGAQLFRTVQLAAMRGYSREQELQADRLGAQYLARVGYDPEAMLGVLDVLADQRAYARAQRGDGADGAQAYHGLFATHPSNDARVQRVVRAARKYRAEQTRDAGRRTYLRHIDGMTFGPSAAGGAVIGDRFVHLELDVALEAPDGWSLDNQAQRLSLAAPDEAARMVVTLESADPEASPRELLAARVGSAELRDPRRLQDGAFPAFAAATRKRTRAGVVRVQRAVVVVDDRAWHFAGTAREPAAFADFAALFDATVQRLRRPTATERRRARPLEIVVDDPAATSYAELAARVPARVNDPVARLRLLNGDYPDDELEPGRLIKTLR